MGKGRAVGGVDGELVTTVAGAGAGANGQLESGDPDVDDAVCSCG